MEAAAAAAPTQHDRDEEDWTGVPETPGYTPGHSSANRSANLDEDEFEGGDFCDYYAVLGLERCCHQDDVKRTSPSPTPPWSGRARSSRSPGLQVRGAAPGLLEPRGEPLRL